MPCEVPTLGTVHVSEPSSGSPASWGWNVCPLSELKSRSISVTPEPNAAPSSSVRQVTVTCWPGS